MGAGDSWGELLDRRIWVRRLGPSRLCPSLRRFTRPLLLSPPAARARRLAARIGEEDSLEAQPGRRIGVQRLGSSRLHSFLHRSTRLFLLSPRAHSHPFTVLFLRRLRTASR